MSGLPNGGSDREVSEMLYLKFYAEDFEILGELDLEDIGTITFWLLAGLARDGEPLPEDARLGAIVKALRHKNLVRECVRGAG